MSIEISCTWGLSILYKAIISWSPVRLTTVNIDERVVAPTLEITFSLSLSFIVLHYSPKFFFKNYKINAHPKQTNFVGVLFFVCAIGFVEIIHMLVFLKFISVW